jgi:hypothetical protein
MKRVASILATLALLTVASLVLVSATPAGPAASKPQRVVMEVKSKVGSGGGTFVLTPLRSGPLKSDAGMIKETISQKHVVRGGQAVIIFTITSTWTGKRGTMVLRERIDDVAGGAGYRVGTGTWSLLRASGTDQYAGLSGGGRSAYVLALKGCCVLFHYEGFVTKP